MKEKKGQPRRPIPAWLRAVFWYLGSLILVLVIIFGVFSVAYANTIYPRVSINGVVVGGLTTTQAKQKLTDQLKNQALAPVILTTATDQSFTIKPSDANVSYNIDQSVQAAMAVGRSGDFLTNLTQKVISPLLGLDIPAKVSYDDGKLTSAITTITNKVNIDKVDAGLAVTNGIVSITPSTVGNIVNTNHLKQDILDQFGSGQNEPIKLKMEKQQPAIKEADAANVKKQAEAVIANPLTLIGNGQNYTVDQNQVGSWIGTKVVTNILGAHLQLNFNEDKISQYASSLASQIDQPAQDARLTVVSGKVQITTDSKTGLALDQAQTKSDIIRVLNLRAVIPGTNTPSVSPSSNLVPTPTADPSPANQLAATSPIPSPTTLVTPTGIVPTPSATPTVSSTDPNQISLKITVKQPEITNNNIDQIGIKERIAVSSTDFRGSPANRQLNITLGTKLFNGIILKPGQQFSAVQSLGRIDASTGFKPELVIKEDQLTPEYGGGLCQVSTTLFRAVLNAGLQVDARQNHSFRVSYYEHKPPNPDPEDYVTNNAKTLVGLDATIYDPNPDFKFTNDTNSYMLIQGHVDGTILTFELFGTKDGRQTAITGPFITSTTPAPTDVAYIDDPTLPAGQTKLKEHAVDGAKAYFTYTVTKDGKPLHNQTFKSVYSTWQAKYYRGTGPATSSPNPSPNASPVVSVQPTDSAAATPTPAAS